MAAEDKFISLVQHVKNTDDIEEDLAYPLMHQSIFDRRTSPWEMSSWDQDELQSFLIDHSCIDRVYVLRSRTDPLSAEGDYSLIARMKYKDKHIFVSLEANCDSSGFDCQGYGEIYVSFDASIFYNTILCEESNNELMFNLLRQDNYDVTVLPESGQSRVTTWHNPSSLLFLCHEAFRHNKHRLAHYADVLPKRVADSLDEFIKVKEAVEELNRIC